MLTGEFYELVWKLNEVRPGDELLSYSWTSHHQGVVNGETWVRVVDSHYSCSGYHDWVLVRTPAGCLVAGHRFHHFSAWRRNLKKEEV